MSLIEIVNRAPVRSIDEAIAIMTAIDERLPDSDGVMNARIIAISRRSQLALPYEQTWLMARFVSK
jgi:hypothetical protein